MSSLVIFDTSSLKALKETLQKQNLRELFERIISKEELVVVKSKSKSEKIRVFGQTITPSKETIGNILREIGIVPYMTRKKVHELSYEDIRDKFIKSNSHLKNVIERIFQVSLSKRNIKKEIDKDVHLIVSALRYIKDFNVVTIVTEDQELITKVSNFKQITNNLVKRLRIMRFRDLISSY